MQLLELYAAGRNGRVCQDLNLLKLIQLIQVVAQEGHVQQHFLLPCPVEAHLGPFPDLLLTLWQSLTMALADPCLLLLGKEMVLLQQHVVVLMADT